jgi:hypothetical protein
MRNLLLNGSYCTRLWLKLEVAFPFLAAEASGAPFVEAFVLSMVWSAYNTIFESWWARRDFPKRFYASIIAGLVLALILSAWFATLSARELLRNPIASYGLGWSCTFIFIFCCGMRAVMGLEDMSIKGNNNCERRTEH